MIWVARSSDKASFDANWRLLIGRLSVYPSTVTLPGTLTISPAIFVTNGVIDVFTAAAPGGNIESPRNVTEL
jgi:hypothetical protein